MLAGGNADGLYVLEKLRATRSNNQFRDSFANTPAALFVGEKTYFETTRRLSSYKRNPILNRKKTHERRYKSHNSCMNAMNICSCIIYMIDNRYLQPMQSANANRKRKKKYFS